MKGNMPDFLGSRFKTNAHHFHLILLAKTVYWLSSDAALRSMQSYMATAWIQEGRRIRTIFTILPICLHGHGPSDLGAKSGTKWLKSVL